ncbi:uncharacterized protein LOC131633041 [Vicia villosa]|uniref:uncharacterized protein LOC131633041 n=1 Tax=Vicia villosa TaxID=3911 RepID=UPI00273ACAC5|nr:uncharacterized protein LOC131633041 [Vicia villosa]
MADLDKDDDHGVDLFPDKDFQLVFNKKKRNKKGKIAYNTRPRSKFVFIAEPWMILENFPQRWLAKFDLKIFAVNNRDSMLPNLWCLCKTNYNLDILLIDDQHVALTINMHNSTYGFSVIYASTSYIHRRNLWNALSNFPVNIPWTFIGDFNAIASVSEYRGSHSPASIPMNDFLNWTDKNQLIHVPTLCNAFTWCNGRKCRHMTEKMLDRAICSIPLMDICHSVVCNTLPKTNSDHYQILLTINFDEIVFRSQFKFHKMWTAHAEYVRIVSESWKVKFHGCPMFILDQKLKHLKNRLKLWNKTTFRNVNDKVTEAGNKLKAIQTDIERLGYTDSLRDQEVSAQHDLDLALNLEEELWKEKSRLNWHLKGDRNTRFFHTDEKIKRKTNLITSLLIDSKIEADQSKLETHVENQNTGLIQKVTPQLVTDQTNDMLIKLSNAMEIHNVVLSLNIDSAPRPDGFGAIFYVHYWDIIKEDLVNVVSQFFLQG